MENEYLKQEEEWSKRVGEQNEFEWIKEGIVIYRSLLRMEPRNIRYRNCLSKLLLNHATDLKIRQENCLEAEKLLKEILELEPSNTVAYYHLGYIRFMGKNWSDALLYLNKSLGCNTKLSTKQKLRALLATAVCNHYLSNEMEAEERYVKAKELDPYNDHSTEFQLVRSQLNEQVRINNKPCIVYQNNQEPYYVTLEEADLIEDKNNKGFLVLNMLESGYPMVYRGDKEKPIQPLEAKLLKELILTGRICSPDSLLDKLFLGTKDKEVVKKYISRLRRKLSLLFNEPMDEIILTVRNHGYKWNHETSYYILCNSLEEQLF